MHNSPELDGKYLGTITRDFAAVSNTLKEASYEMRSRGISQYPIFPICHTNQPIGQLLIAQHEMGLHWHYFFSMMEEFVQRNLIDPEKQDAFKAVYRNPDEFCCLFVIDGAFVNFIYIPYPED